jgi:hypothetical protein
LRALGVAWFVSPESSAYHSPGTTRLHTTQTPQRNTSVAVKVAEQSEGKPANSDGTNTSATAAALGGAKPEDADVSVGDGKIANGHDSVPSGGCMPIDLTAQGEMVFPLQCREKLEAGDAQIGSGMRKLSESKAPVVEGYASGPTTPPGSEPVTTNVKANENANVASASPNESRSNNASMTGAVRPTLKRSDYMGTIRGPWHAQGS